jgi:hypothetical protein
VRLSQLFSRTLRAAPAHSIGTARSLAARAMLSQPRDAPQNAYLPLGARVMALNDVAKNV